MPSSSTAGWRSATVSEAFHPAEVDRLIPRLTVVMERAMKAHAEAGSISARLEAERQRIGLSGGGVIDRTAWRADAERVAELTEAVRHALTEVAEMGGVTKDISLGLVDFLHVRDGREVNLCWKVGENAVRHWHGLDEGYANRRPL
jgi:uncharacterized protein DUF2203